MHVSCLLTMALLHYLSLQRWFSKSIFAINLADVNVQSIFSKQCCRLVGLLSSEQA